MKQLERPVSVEDTVNFLLDDRQTRKCVDPADQKKLQDIRSRTWWSGKPITSRQKGLVCYTISKYLLPLKQAGWPVDDLLEPRWAHASVPSNPILTQHDITWLSEQDQFLMRFPYDENIVDSLRNMRNKDCVFDQIGWNAQLQAWALQNGYQTRAFLRWLIDTDPRWHISDSDRERIDLAADTELTPAVSYELESWHLRNGGNHLSKLFDEIIAQPQTAIHTAWQLSNMALNFDTTARDHLANYISQDQICMLVDRDPVIKHTQLAELSELITAVNRWPVFVVQNRYNTARSIILDLKVSRITYSDLDKNKNVDIVNGIIEGNQKYVIEFSHQLDWKVDMPLSLQLPWMIHAPDLIQMHSDMFNFGSDNYYRYNFARYIRVSGGL